MRPSRASRWTVAVASLAVSVATLAGQASGIRAVTASDAKQAVALGQGDGDISQLPLLTRLRALHDQQEPTSFPGPKDFQEMQRFLHSSPFIFKVESPYTRIALRVRGWRGVANAPAALTAEEANRDLVAIQVLPGPNLDTADDVKDVYIRRGGTDWKPLRSATRRTYRMRSGDREKLFWIGTFTFPLEVFDPSSDISVVIVGTKGDFEWTIVRDELSAMK